MAYPQQYQHLQHAHSNQNGVNGQLQHAAQHLNDHEMPGAPHRYPTPVPSARSRFVELLNKHQLPIKIFINEQMEIGLNDLSNLDHARFDELCKFLKLNPVEKIRFEKLVNELSDGEQDLNQKKKSIDIYERNKTIPTSKNESLLIQQLDEEHKKMKCISALCHDQIARTDEKCSLCHEQINKIFEQQRQSFLFALQTKKHELQQHINQFKSNQIAFIRSQFKDIDEYQAEIAQTRDLCSNILESQPYGEDRESSITQIIGKILTEKGTFRDRTEMHKYLGEISKELKIEYDARVLEICIQQLVSLGFTVTEEVKAKMTAIHQLSAQQLQNSQHLEQSPQHPASAYLNGESYDLQSSAASAPITPQQNVFGSHSIAAYALQNHVSADMVDEYNQQHKELNLMHSFSNPPPNNLKSLSYSGLHSLPQSPESQRLSQASLHDHSNNNNKRPQRMAGNHTHVQPAVNSTNPHAPPASFASHIRETKRGSYQEVTFKDALNSSLSNDLQPQQIRNRPHSFAYSDQSYVPVFTATPNGNASLPFLNGNQSLFMESLYSSQAQPPNAAMLPYSAPPVANGHYYNIPHGNNAVHIQFANSNHNNGNEQRRNSVPPVLTQSESNHEDDANISAFLSDHKSQEDSHDDSEEMFNPVAPTPTPNGDVTLHSTAKLPSKPNLNSPKLNGQNSGMDINITDANLLGIDPIEMLQDYNKKQEQKQQQQEPQKSPFMEPINFEQNRRASNHSQIGSSPAISRSRASSQYSAKWAIYAVGHNMSFELGINHNNNLSFFEQMDWSIDDTRATFAPSAFDLTALNVASDEIHDEEDEKKDILDAVTANGGAPIYHRRVYNDCLTHIRSGPGFCIYLFGGGGLYVSGSNASGCFSIGKEKKGTYIQTLTQHSFFQNHSMHLRYLSTGCSGHHSFVIDQNDSIYAMGEGSHYQLAIDDEEVVKKKHNHVPLRVTYFDRLHISISHISCGKKFSVFVSETGDTYSCGTNIFGALGFGDEITTLKQPKLIERLKSTKAKDVSCGENHSVILDTSGRIWSFGINNLGQLGRNTKNNLDYPGFVHITSRKVSFGASHTRIEKISSGENHIGVISESGKCFVWGANDRGQCGDGTQKVRYKARQLLKGEQIKDIKCGANHTVVITKQRKVWLFGCNEYHQCQQQPQQSSENKKSKRNANRNNNYLLTPTLLTVESNPDIDQQIKKVFAGANSTFICVDTAMEILRTVI